MHNSFFKFKLNFNWLTMHCYVPRYDWPAVWRIQVSVRGPAGNRKRNSSAAIQRSCYCGGAGKYCLFTVPVLLLTNMYHHECMLFFFFSLLLLRRRPLRRWTTCWRATWASETASLVSTERLLISVKITVF